MLFIILEAGDARGNDGEMLAGVEFESRLGNLREHGIAGASDDAEVEAHIRPVEKVDRSRREALHVRQETVQQRHCIVNSRWRLGDLAPCGNVFDSMAFPYFLAVVDEFTMGNSVRCP